MSTFKLHQFLLYPAFVVFIAACSSDAAGPAPVANELTCNDGTLSRIKDEKQKTKFADACFLRGTYKPSAPMEWKTP